MTESEFVKEKQKILKSMPDTICLTRAEAKSILEELERYRAMGTVEECREAVERLRAKKPDTKPDKYTDLVQHYWCPVCGKYFGHAGIHNEILLDKPKYCTCGQAISWEESEG